ncbi:MAG: hypothetical protein M3M87_04725, partial [Thermoproteota archaeon]|nr:hypothetical protein [Thermoproteota archaeon]
MQDGRLSNEVRYDLTLGIQHEMQHQELMIYDFQHYFHRFSDPEDSYIPGKKNEPHATKGKQPAGMTEIPGGIY